MKVLPTDGNVTHFEYRLLSTMECLGQGDYTAHELNKALEGNYTSTYKSLNSLVEKKLIEKCQARQRGGFLYKLIV